MSEQAQKLPRNALTNHDQKILHEGHRERVYEKLMYNGYSTMLDYEIVELILYLVFKRQDTKPIAKTLIKRFGTVDKILSASPQDLLSIEGVGKAAVHAIKIIDAVIKSSLQSKIIKRSIIECFDDVLKYCRTNMQNLTAEEFRILFLNGVREVIGDEVVRKGTIDSVEVCPREIVRQCIEKGAKGFILVHNHPSGDPTPSVNDVYVTKRIKEAADIFGIDLHDHIVIGDCKHVSFRTLGLIE
ncbi:MAG: DNA repair protein RadC [Holosporales bacterium]|jgi:DNA repair protein RadC|nr:DNA repair protein RadC [Holosporales bacterium]